MPRPLAALTVRHSRRTPQARYGTQRPPDGTQHREPALTDEGQVIRCCDLLHPSARDADEQRSVRNSRGLCDGGCAPQQRQLRKRRDSRTRRHLNAHWHVANRYVAGAGASARMAAGEHLAAVGAAPDAWRRHSQQSPAARRRRRGVAARVGVQTERRVGGLGVQVGVRVGDQEGVIVRLPGRGDGGRGVGGGERVGSTGRGGLRLRRKRRRMTGNSVGGGCGLGGASGRAAGVGALLRHGRQYCSGQARLWHTAGAGPRGVAAPRTCTCAALKLAPAPVDASSRARVRNAW